MKYGTREYERAKDHWMKKTKGNEHDFYLINEKWRDMGKEDWYWKSKWPRKKPDWVS